MKQVAQCESGDFVALVTALQTASEVRKGAMDPPGFWSAAMEPVHGKLGLVVRALR